MSFHFDTMAVLFSGSNGSIRERWEEQSLRSPEAMNLLWRLPRTVNGVLFQGDASLAKPAGICELRYIAALVEICWRFQISEGVKAAAFWWCTGVGWYRKLQFRWVELFDLTVLPPSNDGQGQGSFCQMSEWMWLTQIFCWEAHWSMGISGSNRWRYVSTIVLAIFARIRFPYISLIYGRYLQSMKWQFNLWNMGKCPWWFQQSRTGTSWSMTISHDPKCGLIVDLPSGNLT